MFLQIPAGFLITGNEMPSLAKIRIWLERWVSRRGGEREEARGVPTVDG